MEESLKWLLESLHIKSEACMIFTGHTIRLHFNKNVPTIIDKPYESQITSNLPSFPKSPVVKLVHTNVSLLLVSNQHNQV